MKKGKGKGKLEGLALHVKLGPQGQPYRQAVRLITCSDTGLGKLATNLPMYQAAHTLFYLSHAPHALFLKPYCTNGKPIKKGLLVCWCLFCWFVGYL